MKIDELPEIDVFSPSFVSDPDSVVAEARDSLGLARSARGIEVLSYDGITELLRSEGFWSATEVMLDLLGIEQGPVYKAATHLLPSLEGDIHRRQRLAVMPWFTPKRAEGLRATVRTWIDEWLDEVPGDGDVDLYGVVTRRLPATLFCHIIGAPLDYWEKVAGWSEDILALPSFDPAARARVKRGFEETVEFIHGVVEDKRGNPGDDLVSTALDAERNGKVSTEDIVDVCVTVLGGSTDTTNTQICLNLETLAAHPEAWPVLQAEDADLRCAVNELMRFNPGMMARNRMAYPDTKEFKGLEIPEGVMLWGCFASGNFDPAVYDNARTLDLKRDMRRQPLNFGFGRHLCVGRVISQVEQEEVLRALARRWKGFEVSSSRFSGEPIARVVEEFTVSAVSV